MTEPTNEVQQLRKEVQELRADIHELLEAWRTASGVVRVVKWVGGMATSIAAIYALFRLGGGK